MKARLSEGGVRLRLDPPDLAALEAGRPVAFEVAGAVSLRVELEVSDEGVSGVIFGAGLVRVMLDDAQVARLADPAVEDIEFARPLPEGRELTCRVEKDRRTFAPRHKAPRAD